jgi:hypothetical protein
MIPLPIAILLCLALVTAVAGWIRAERRLVKESQLHARTVAYLAANPPLPRVQKVELIDPHKFADPEKEMVRVLDFNDKPATLGFTDASYQQALLHGGRLEALLSHGQAKLLKK